MEPNLQTESPEELREMMRNEIRDLRRALSKAATMALVSDGAWYQPFKAAYFEAEERSAAIGGYGHAWDLAGEVFMQFLLGRINE
jgi:hypothetical protein